MQVLIFTAGGERFAVDVRHVREVQALEHLTPVPCTPPFVAGITNLRGRLYLVISLPAFLGFGSAPPPACPCRAVVLEAGGYELCVLTDDLSDVIDLDPGAIEPPLITQGGLCREFAAGLLPNGSATLLRVDALLQDPRLVIDDPLD